MIKKRYYGNECLDLAWDRIKVLQNCLFTTTFTFIKSLENRGYSEGTKGPKGTENMVRKIGEFEKPKFENFRVIYKDFLRQTQGTKENV